MIFYGVFLAGAAKMMIKQRINGIPVTETSSKEGQEEEKGGEKDHDQESAVSWNYIKDRYC